jgi:uncharacterized protein (TIGR03083 family)
VSSDWDAVIEERAALIDLLADLTPAQWETPSLCPAWTVHGVVAHLASVLAAGPRDILAAGVAGRGIPSKVTEALAQRWADRSPEEILAALRQRVASHFHPPGLGYRAPLTEQMVHRLDVAVPLGLRVQRPVERWRPVLDFLGSRLPMGGVIRRGAPRVTWHATDVAWERGDGPVVSGTAAAIGLTLAGRDGRLDDLEGSGVDCVRAWLSG